MHKLLFIALFVLLSGGVSSAHGSEVGDDGLHKQDWFALTFKDIAEDITEAKSDGKRLALLFEQKGCIYCRKMHENILSDPEISAFIQDNFKVVQYNIFGDEEVTDLDGETLSEKDVIGKWDVLFTPTIIFLPEDVPASGHVGTAEVARMPGGFGKWTFINMFKWVREKGYDGDEHFQKYHARMLEDLKAAGKLTDE